MKTIFALRHVLQEHLGLLASFFQRSGLPVRYVDLFDNPPDALDLADAAGLVVLGGPMNVDQMDRFPFLAREVEWIRDALDRDLPTLGICLGSQLLAKALGARVYPNRLKEIGWYPLQLTDAAADDALFAQLPRELTVFQWHGDTFDLPPGAVHLAASDGCRNQAFRYGRAAYALQFHLEVTAEVIDEWLIEPGCCAELASLPYIDSATIRQDTNRCIGKLAELADHVLGGFVQLCASRST